MKISPAEEEKEELLEFRDTKNRVRLKRPAGWSQTDKAGAVVLFKGPAEVGLTVLPVRISRLDQFGDVETVGKRLLGAERAKVEHFTCH
jgi:hypothetical protein